jgi:hypothetical protein
MLAERLANKNPTQPLALVHSKSRAIVQLHGGQVPLSGKD